MRIVGYRAKKCAPFSEKESSVVCDELVKIANKRGGLEPAFVIEAAKSLRHPLHKYFEWDDTKAAYAHRKYQARQIINHVEVVYKEKDKEFRTSAFMNIVTYSKDDDLVDQKYYGFKTVMENQALREKRVRDAMRELESWCDKYEMFNECISMINHIRLYGFDVVT